MENILTRVTGTQPSGISGTLGVQGNANLFLLNPHGIIFGPDAHLDIAGSLVATTAESLVFDNGILFSATNPQAPPLLTINLTPGLQYGSTQPRASITNVGSIAVGQNLTLIADQLNLLAPLTTGGDLSLLAIGNVRLNRYQGASLHILAGGQVDIGTVTITGTETGTTGVNALAEELTRSNGMTLAVDGSRQPALDVRAGISPDEIGILGVNGNFDGLNPSNSLVPTSADISIGTVTMRAPNGVVFLTNQYNPNPSLSTGAIAVGTIHTDDTSGGFSGSSSSVMIDSRAGITVGDRIDTSSSSGDAGAIVLVAKEAIALDHSLLITDTTGLGKGGDITMEAGSVALTNGGQVQSSTTGRGNAGDVSIVARGQVLVSGSSDTRNSAILSQVNPNSTGDGGTITIQADSVLVSNRARLLATTDGQGNAGSVRILASGSASFWDEVNVFSNVQEHGIGDAGGIYIEAESVFLNSRLEARTWGQGNSGDITIIADNITSLGGNFISSVQRGAVGDAGNITIKANSVSLTRGSIQSNTIGRGDAGDVRIIVTDSLVFDDLLVLSRVNSEATGKGGDIYIQTGSLSATNGTRLIARTQGQGDAGNVTIIAKDFVSFDGMNQRGELGGAFSSVESRALGNGGNIYIQTGSLSVTNGAQLVTRTGGQGDAGKITIVAQGAVSFRGVSADGNSSGAFSSVVGGALGNGGEIRIQAESVSVTDRARLDASTRGEGDAGNLTLSTGQLTVRDRGAISASTLGQRDAGDITIKAADSAIIANDGVISSGVGVEASGNGGDIAIATPSLSLINGGRVETQTLGFIPAVLGNTVAQQYANTSYNAAVQADNPISYWRFDETSGSTALDVSGNHFNGTYQGGVTLRQAGVSGTAAEFDGINGVVDIGRIASRSGLDLQRRSLTLEAWIKPNTSPPREQVYLGLHSNVQSNQSLHLRVYEDGSTRFGYLHDDLDTLPDTVTFGDNWYHIVVRYDQALDTSTVFVNGNPVSSSSQGPFTGSAPSGAIGNWRNVNDPAFNDPSFFNQPFNGLIDEVALYDTALSLESIAAHYILGQRNLGAPMAFKDSGANAGNITVRAESINLSGVSPTQGSPSGFFSDTEGQFSGHGGNINITTGSLRVADGAVVSARSQGAGDAGNVNAIANFVELDNAGKLTAETAVGNGGNIRLRVQDLLLLRRNSEISTTAGKAGAGGDGGNITINADLIVAVPQENSDITADAFEGRGGNINITTQGIFGIEVRNHPTPVNDITASSQLGIDGNVEINSPDVDPGRGLAELPSNLVDATGLVDHSCSVDRGTTQHSSFTLTGRGGLPPNPHEALSPDGDWEDWRIVEDNEQPTGQTTESLQRSELTPNRQQTIVEANGWVKNPDGQVILVAQASNVASQASWLPSPFCQGM
ncbi:MAG: filamentous hemagglutinin N-terminal domain-containing protein [Coleofasciculus sp. S288]|nr:filamentous hemagglutinin N-terminal domain-containing protein [Coleofasciculus sp. S288]